MDGIHLSNKIGIVGGGITGLISAYFLSQEGYKVDLYEKKTLLSETSSKTTKLIHGGIRSVSYTHLTLPTKRIV